MKYIKLILLILNMIPAAILFKPTCTCSKQLGSRQQEIEDLVSNGLSLSKAIDKLGFIAMCCRSSLLNASMYFIRSTNKGRIIDEIGHIDRPSFSYTTFDFHVEDSPDIVTIKNPPNFPGEIDQSNSSKKLIGNDGTILSDIVRENMGIEDETQPVVTNIQKSKIVPLPVYRVFSKSDIGIIPKIKKIPK